MTLLDLSHVNASLNALATILLITGFLLIRKRFVSGHKFCMVAAFVVSVLFLISYLTYHTARQMQEGVGHTEFTGTGFIAKVYYALLISHIILAAAVPVLVIITLRHAIRSDFDRHRRIARWTFPIWLYVSVTGVIVYVMLYHLYA